MTHATLVVRNIGELVTCDPERGTAPGVISDAVLVADGDRIVYCGSAGDYDGDGDEELDAGGAAVVPGFVDSHTHLVWAGERSAEYAERASGVSYEAIASRGGGILATVAATSAQNVAALTALAAPRAERMLRGGTTTVEVKSGYGLALDAEVRQIDAARALRGPRAPDVHTTYLPLHALPAGDRTAYLDAVIHDGLPAVRDRATWVDMFCEQGAWTVEEGERLCRAAQALGYGLRLHAEQRSASGAARLAARHGAHSADHLEHASDADLAALAAAGTVATLLPGAALVLDGPPPPGRRAVAAGCTVAIATDCNPGTCYAESMSLMVSLAVATAGLSPAEAVIAATRGGAVAMRLTDRGVLRVGMRCDAVVLRTARWLDLAYHLGGDEIGTVILGGRPVPPA